ncbi:MAG: caspase family protein [Pirellulales bacterium]
MKRVSWGMRWFFGMCAAASTCWVGTASYAGQRYALLVGVNEYDKESGLASLNYASDDVEALAEVLSRRGYNKRNIRVLRSAADDSSMVPTRENIVQSLRILTEELRLSPDDSMLIVFAGHGFNSNGESYLCPMNYDGLKAEDSSIRVADIATMLAKVPAGEKYVVIDACRNDDRRDKKREFNLLSGLQKMSLRSDSAPQGIMFFSSCLAGQQSFEDEQLKHGVFMNFFIEGIDGYADHAGNFDGKVSAFELSEYAAKKTNEYVQPRFDAGQRPWADSHSTSDLCVSVISDDDKNALEAKLGAVKRIDPETARLTALKQLARQQAEEEIDDAIGLLAINEYNLTMSRVDRAVEFDSEYYLARRLRSLIHVLQGNIDSKSATTHYQAAVADMRAVNSRLRIRVPSSTSSLPLKIVHDVVETVSPGDVLQIEEVAQTPTDSWLLVTGIRRAANKDSGNKSFEKVAEKGAYVSLAQLAIPSANRDQLIEYAESKNSNIMASNSQYQNGLSLDGTRIQNAAEAINHVNGVIGAVNGNIPFGPSIPTVPNYPQQGINFVEGMVGRYSGGIF